MCTCAIQQYHCIPLYGVKLHVPCYHEHIYIYTNVECYNIIYKLCMCAALSSAAHEVACMCDVRNEEPARYKPTSNHDSLEATSANY